MRRERITRIKNNNSLAGELKNCLLVHVLSFNAWWWIAKIPISSKSAYMSVTFAISCKCSYVHTYVWRENNVKFVCWVRPPDMHLVATSNCALTMPPHLFCLGILCPFIIIPASCWPDYQCMNWRLIWIPYLWIMKSQGWAKKSSIIRLKLYEKFKRISGQRITLK